MSLLNKMISHKKVAPSTDSYGMELCACCSAVTSVPISQPIETRSNFVSGCGQLCPECYAKLCSYAPKDKDIQIVNAAFKKSGK